MKKSTIYLATTFILLFAIIWILFGKSSATSGDQTDSSSYSGDYQKVVISLKNGNYYPNVITVDSGKPVRVYLDSSVQGCYRNFLIPSLGVQKSMFSTSDYAQFTPNQVGTYGFRCGMGMGRGTLIVK